jgi:hypothetical protein
LRPWRTTSWSSTIKTLVLTKRDSNCFAFNCRHWGGRVLGTLRRWTDKSQSKGSPTSSKRWPRW